MWTTRNRYCSRDTDEDPLWTGQTLRFYFSTLSACLPSEYGDRGESQIPVTTWLPEETWEACFIPAPWWRWFYAVLLRSAELDLAIPMAFPCFVWLPQLASAF